MENLAAVEIEGKMASPVDCRPKDDVLLSIELTYTATCVVAGDSVRSVEKALFIAFCFDTEILDRDVVEERENTDSSVDTSAVKFKLYCPCGVIVVGETG